jgi:hypothetical protein
MSAFEQQPDLLDQFLPRWTFAHRHAIVVDSGDIAAIYDIARDVNLAKSRFIGPLFKLRGLPAKELNARAFAAAMGWSEMAQRLDTEFIIGYWRSHRVEPVFSRAQFLGNTPGARQKVAFSFRFSRLGPDRVRVDTETRVLCIGRFRTWRYRLYWMATKPFSSLIRKETLKLIKREAEARALAPLEVPLHAQNGAGKDQRERVGNDDRPGFQRQPVQ